MITELNPNQIFVFGSNLAGRHGAGAAKQAREQFGAEIGCGDGSDGKLKSLADYRLNESGEFIEVKK